MKSMYQELERCIERRGDFFQIRRRISTDYLFERETGNDTGESTPLKSLFEFWRDNRARGDAPLVDAIEERKPALSPKISHLSWIDVASENPFNFVLHNHPARIFGDFSNTKIGVYPHEFHAIRCAFEYEHCKKTRQPAYHEFEQIVGGYKRNYARLMVPALDKSGEVTKLFYTTRYLADPVSQ